MDATADSAENKSARCQAQQSGICMFMYGSGSGIVIYTEVRYLLIL